MELFCVIFCVTNFRIVDAIVYIQARYMIDRMHSSQPVDNPYFCSSLHGFDPCFGRIFPIQFSVSSCGQTRVLIYWWGKSAVHKVTPYPKNPKYFIGCRVVPNITYII